MAKFINPKKVLDLVKEAGNTIFSVVFIKKNGDVREMQCRRHVKKGVKGTAKHNRSDEDARCKVLTVYDMAKIVDGERGAFRRINVETVQKIKVKGVEYVVAEEAAA